jgi:hypothetical protein
MSPHAVKPILRRVFAVALCALTLPAAAQAATGTASVSYGRLSYTAAAGDANHVVVTATGSTVVLAETGTGASIAAGSGCTGSGSSVTCTGVYSMGIAAGDGDNFVDSRGAALPTTVTSGAGADRVYTGASADSLTTGGGADWLDGGAGADFYSAGGGDDVVIARDGAREMVGCGTGNDIGTDDDNDYTNSDCESLGTTPPSDPAAPGDPVPPAGDPSNPSDPTNPTDPAGPAGNNDPTVGNGLTGPLNLEPPVVLAQTAPVKNGVAAIRIGCPLDAGGCKGTVELFLVKAKKKPGTMSAARRRPPARIGHAKFHARAGTKPTVRVRLDRRGRRRVMRRRKLPVRVVVTTRTATGQTVRTARRIKLRAERRRRG